MRHLLQQSLINSLPKRRENVCGTNATVSVPPSIREKMQFLVGTNAYSLTSEEIARSELLTELLPFAVDGVCKMEQITEEDFLVAYRYLHEGVIPTPEQYPVIEYFRIPPEDSYALSCVLEDDMRRNMYSSDVNIPTDKYFSQSYGLQIIDAAFWEEFTPKRLESPELLFAGPVPQKASWSEITARLEELASFVREEGCLVAGGAIFSILFGLPIADIDLFYYGINEEEATRRVTEFDACDRNKALRTKNAITYYDDLCGKTPEVQVILRLYKTRSEVVHGFDVDSCSIGYCGKHIYVTNRAMYALKNLVNTVNFERLSPSYERRLAKYAGRGIAVRVPNFDRSRVNIDALESDFCLHRTQEGDNTTHNYRHLASKAPLDTLLYLEKHLEIYKYARRPANMVQNFSNEVCDYMPGKTGVPRHNFNGTYIEWLLNYLMDCDPEGKYGEKVRAYLPLLESIEREPWHDNVTITNIPSSKSVYFLRGPREHLREICDFDSRLYEAFSIVRPFDFPAKLTWKTTLPGEQMTNTFHSIVLQDKSVWYNGCYYNSPVDATRAKAVIVPVALFDLDVDDSDDDSEQGPIALTPEMEEFLAQREVRDYDVVYLCSKCDYPYDPYLYLHGKLTLFPQNKMLEHLSPQRQTDYWRKVISHYSFRNLKGVCNPNGSVTLTLTGEELPFSKRSYKPTPGEKVRVYVNCCYGERYASASKPRTEKR